jgi:hypothetical protein
MDHRRHESVVSAYTLLIVMQAKNLQDIRHAKIQEADEEKLGEGFKRARHVYDACIIIHANWQFEIGCMMTLLEWSSVMQ